MTNANVTAATDELELDLDSELNTELFDDDSDVGDVAAAAKVSSSKKGDNIIVDGVTYTKFDKKYGIKLTPEQQDAFEVHYQNNEQILNYFAQNGMPYNQIFKNRQIAATRFQKLKYYNEIADEYIKYTDAEITNKRNESIATAEAKLSALVKKGKTETDEGVIKATEKLNEVKALLKAPIPAHTVDQTIESSKFSEWGVVFTERMTLMEFLNVVNLKDIQTYVSDDETYRLVVTIAYKLQQFRKTERAPANKKQIPPIVMVGIADILVL